MRSRQGRIPEGDATPDEVIAITDKSAAANTGAALPDSDPDEEGDMAAEGAVA